MDRILEAIEKAKQERGENASRGWLNAPQDRDADSHGTLSYTHSKKISFTDQYMKSRLILAGFAHDRRSDPYRHLRTQVLKIMRKNHWKTLAITSPNAKNGKTLTALNLAVSLSQEVNQTVLLIDLDLRQPAVALSFGMSDIQAGIVECAFGKSRLEEILFTPGYDRLVIAPGVPQGHQTSEILSSPSMLKLLDEIKHRYHDRIILFDLPALLASDDALAFIPHADAVLLVIEDGGSSKNELTHALKLIEGANLLGTVVNKIR